jgi:hypothetical protein
MVLCTTIAVYCQTYVQLHRRVRWQHACTHYSFEVGAVAAFTPNTCS